MNIQEVKQRLSDNQDINDFLIFLAEGDNEVFTAEQYVDKLCHVREARKVLLDSLSDIFTLSHKKLLQDPVLYVYKTDKLSDIPPRREDLVVIARKVDSAVLEDVSQNTLKIPHVEEWMIEDHILSICPKLSERDISWFISYFEGNLYRISLELQKLTLFPADIQSSLFADFKRHDVFVNYRDGNTFKLSNALQLKDREKIREVLSDKTAIDLEAMSFISVWQNNLKKLIKVWLNKSPNPENTGLKSNQIWAINKLPRTYSKEQLRAALELIDKMGYLIKNGSFPPELVIDYVVVKTLRG